MKLPDGLSGDELYDVAWPKHRVQVCVCVLACVRLCNLVFAVLAGILHRP